MPFTGSAQTGGLSSEDMKEIANPPGLENFPPIVARIQAGAWEEEVSGHLLASTIAWEQELNGITRSLQEVVDTLLMEAAFYFAAKRRGLEPSEQEAAAAIDHHLEAARNSPDPGVRAYQQWLEENVPYEEMIALWQRTKAKSNLMGQLLSGLTYEEQVDSVKVNEILVAFAQEELKAMKYKVFPSAFLGLQEECYDQGLKVVCPPEGPPVPPGPPITPPGQATPGPSPTPLPELTPVPTATPFPNLSPTPGQREERR